MINIYFNQIFSNRSKVRVIVQN